MHDVFISYASQNKPEAFAVCHALENAGVRCWIAPRDVAAGMDYAQCITKAMPEARVLVLVYSKHSNQSEMVQREVHLAADLRKPLLPFRIEDTPPSDAMKFLIAGKHWLDAMTPPLESHLAGLVTAVKGLVGAPVTQPNQPPRQPPPPPGAGAQQSPPTSKVSVGVVIICGFIMVALAGGMGVYLYVQSARAREQVEAARIAQAEREARAKQEAAQKATGSNDGGARPVAPLVTPADNGASEAPNPSNTFKPPAQLSAADLVARARSLVPLAQLKVDPLGENRATVRGAVVTEAERTEITRLLQPIAQQLEVSVEVNPKEVARLIRSALKDAGIPGASAEDRGNPVDWISVRFTKGDKFTTDQVKALAARYVLRESIIRVTEDP